MTQGHEFNDAELYPCDRCGEAFPMEEMYVQEDGSVICEYCQEEISNP